MVTKDITILLLLENHQSRFSLRVLDFAKENGVVLLSFSTNTTYKLESLYKSFYGPFTKFASMPLDSVLARCIQFVHLNVFYLISILILSRIPGLAWLKIMGSGFGLRVLEFLLQLQSIITAHTLNSFWTTSVWQMSHEEFLTPWMHEWTPFYNCHAARL
jgi:hypothetical protein